MLHFFVDSGINDTPYFWGEFQKALKLYVELKKESKNLDSFNLPFFLAREAAISVNTVTCAVNALVEATPISGPACV